MPSALRQDLKPRQSPQDSELIVLGLGIIVDGFWIVGELVEEVKRVVGEGCFVVVGWRVGVGIIEEAVVVGFRVDLEVGERGGGEVLDQHAESGVVTFDFGKFVQGTHEQLANEVIFGGVKAGGFRVIDWVGG